MLNASENSLNCFSFPSVLVRLFYFIRLLAGDDTSEATKEEASTESEGEDKAVDGKKKSKLPRRKFEYTVEIKYVIFVYIFQI